VGELIDAHAADGVAAVLMEPNAGTNGIVAPPAYWPALRGVTREKGAYLIADEVMSGFGRCGEWFAWQRYGEEGRPDLMTLAKGLTGAHLPLGAVVGTSSLRRTVLLQSLRPDLKIEPLRGNLDTRLKKLDDGQYAGIVLAAAGLKRLGLKDRIRHIFDLNTMVPAAGQGAIGIEISSNRMDLIQTLAGLNDITTAVAVYAERGVSRAMGGSCSMPLAAHATIHQGTLSIHAAWGDHLKAGTALIHAHDQKTIDLQDPDALTVASALGESVARKLIAQGAVPSQNPSAPLNAPPH
jgi:hydroxymethylbilane synthase